VLCVATLSKRLDSSGLLVCSRNRTLCTKDLNAICDKCEMVEVRCFWNRLDKRMECGSLGDETAVVMVMTVFLRCFVLCGFGRTFELTVFLGGGFCWDSSLVWKLNRLDAVHAGFFFFVYH